MKISLLALVLACASLMLSFAALGEARDTYRDVDPAIATYNELSVRMNEAIAGYNQAGADYNRIAAEYDAQRLELNAAVDSYNRVIAGYEAQVAWFDRFREEVERELGHSI